MSFLSLSLAGSECSYSEFDSANDFSLNRLSRESPFLSTSNSSLASSDIFSSASTSKSTLNRNAAPFVSERFQHNRVNSFPSLITKRPINHNTSLQPLPSLKPLQSLTFQSQHSEFSLQSNSCDDDFGVWQAPETPRDRQVREQTLIGTLYWGEPSKRQNVKIDFWNDEYHNKRNQELPNKTFPSIQQSSQWCSKAPIVKQQQSSDSSFVPKPCNPKTLVVPQLRPNLWSVPNSYTSINSSTRSASRVSDFSERLSPSIYRPSNSNTSVSDLTKEMQDSFFLNSSTQSSKKSVNHCDNLYDFAHDSSSFDEYIWKFRPEEESFFLNNSNPCLSSFLVDHDLIRQV